MLDTFSDSTGLQGWSLSPVIWPLLLSVLLHLILFVYLWERWEKGGSNSAARLEPAMPHFKLLPGQVSADRSVSPDVTVEPELQSSKVESEQPQLKADNSPAEEGSGPARPTATSAARTLNLSLPETITPSSDAVPLERSATVFDPQLTQTIEDARRRPRGLSLATPQIQSGETFVGGQWRSFIEIGNLCFEIIAADPLDSLSTDQWYRRSCD